MRTANSSLVVLLRTVAVVQIAMVAVNLGLTQVFSSNDGLTRLAAVRELFVGGNNAKRSTSCDAR